jgi:secreted Zn-dependent insulinase-like peptidase
MSKIHENSNSIERVDNITKSSHDKRNYRGILLNNQLKCLLISDFTTEKSAASIDVHVGNMHEGLPGLAHFCEQ